MIHLSRRTSLWILAVVGLFAGATAAVGRQEDPAKLITSRDPAEKLRAITILRNQGHKKAESMLLKAAKGKDWEVVERAVQALGVRGSPESTKQLLILAVRHPLRRVRLAASRALGSTDPEVAAAKLAKKLRGDEFLRVAESLAWMGAEQSAEEFEKLFSSDDAGLRQAGVAGFAALRTRDAVQRLQAALEDEDLSVRAAVVEALAEIPDPSSIPPLLLALTQPRVPDVMERRLIQALYRLSSRLEVDEQKTALKDCLDAWSEDCSAPVAARLARLLGLLCEGEPALPLREKRLEVLMTRGLAHEESETRAAAVNALGRAGARVAWQALVEIAGTDASDRVRFHALRSLVQIDPEGAVAALTQSLASDAQATVREEAAVLLSTAFDPSALPALRAALTDPRWPVMLAAAIALGTHRDQDSVPLLLGFLDADDWKLRASALTGLAKIGSRPVIDGMIAALDDRDPVVVSTAHEFLQTLTRKVIGPQSRKWKKWWAKNADSYTVESEEPERDSRYADTGFQRKPYASLQASDVIVLTSGIDRLEDLLEKLKIEHRLTLAGEVHESELHPNAVFLANCRGNIEESDVERLDWFVRSGGYLLTSCWGLTNTAARVFPGVIEAAPRGTQPPGEIPATPVREGSTFLEGVFARAVDTSFHLQGYQIIRVLDPERYEVLIDSPAGATRWGAGNLAGWFSVGHGVVFNSTNHFALAGMRGRHFDDEDQRKAFAIERLGYSYQEVREFAKKGHFRRDASAAAACDDLTILRLVARFVYVKHKNLLR